MRARLRTLGTYAICRDDSIAKFKSKYCCKCKYYFKVLCDEDNCMNKIRVYNSGQSVRYKKNPYFLLICENYRPKETKLFKQLARTL